VRAELALSADMQGRPADGESRLGTTGALGAASSAEIAVVRARLLLDAGQPAAAIAALPAPRDGTAMPEGAEAVRGAALCQQGAVDEGQALLRHDLEASLAGHAAASPFSARKRAVLGLCVLARGQVADAAALAAQSRRAVSSLGAVNPYFVQPLAALEGALAARGVHVPSQL
jgi:hypothetical protein